MLINNLGDRCTGCGACSANCPQHCIDMKSDNEGFIVPEVDEKICLQCKICEKICPVINKRNLHTVSMPNVKGIKAKKNSEALQRSASAGVVYSLSKYIIQMGGIVSGAAFINRTVKHIVVSSIDDLREIQNSKYVQSYSRDVFSLLRDWLKREPEKYILFCGTPCQCAAFKNLITQIKNTPNLFIVDFVCHGVSSPLMFDKYCEYIKYKLRDEVKFFQFRYKHKGWNYHGYMSSYIKANNSVWSTQRDPYMVNFLHATDYRECCYNCSFILEKGSDITVGDFGGVKEIAPKFFDKNGCSIVMAHTERGRFLLEKVINDFDTIQVDFNTEAKFNSNMIKCSQRPPIRDKIYENINKYNGIEYVRNNLIKQVTIKNLIKFYIPESIKRMAKQSLGKQRD